MLSKKSYLTIFAPLPLTWRVCTSTFHRSNFSAVMELSNCRGSTLLGPFESDSWLRNRWGKLPKLGRCRDCNLYKCATRINVSIRLARMYHNNLLPFVVVLFGCCLLLLLALILHLSFLFSSKEFWPSPWLSRICYHPNRFCQNWFY